MTAVSREKIAGRFNSIKYGGAADLSSKLDQLRRLRDELLAADSLLVVEFLSPALDLLSDHMSPVRKFITQMIGEIGLKHLELLPEIIPALVDILKDDTPAVARQAISCGFDIFRYSLVNLAVQGLYSSEFDESLRSSWECVLKFRDEICSMAFKEGSEGRKLPALKFVESVVLLYTPDPHGSLEPPSDTISEGNFDEFNVSWLRGGGHPILNVRDLSAEASQSLSLLLDQLRSPSLKSHSYLVIIVLIKSLSAVARKRPAFYGRILPVLLGLDPSSSVRGGMHLAGVHHALKNAFESCLNCTHPGAAPWRDRLVNALKDIKVGKSIGQAANEMSENNGRTEWTRDSNVAQIIEDEKPPMKSVTEHNSAGRKRTGVPDSLDGNEDDMCGKRARSTPSNLEGPGNEMNKVQDRAPSRGTSPLSDVDSGPVQQLVAMFAALVAQGEKAAASLEILISSISADLLAEVVMANIRNLPPKRPEFEEDEELLISTADNPEMMGSDTHIKHLSLLLKDILLQSTLSQEKGTGVGDPLHVVSSELKQTIKEEPQVTLADSNIAYDDLTITREQATVSVSESVCPEDIPPPVKTGYMIKSEVSDIEGRTNEIPGLSSATQDDGLPENMDSIPKGLTDSDDANEEMFTGLGGTSIESDRVPTEIAQSLSTDRSEELSPKAAITDANGLNSSTATSVRLASQLVLPTIAAPVIHLADDQKDQIQLLAFARIIDAYKQVTVAGCSQVRFSILAHAGMEYPSELDPWKLLKTHVLSDYVNNEGHELTLRVLYRLFGEAEEDRDFFISTTARSVYEAFILQVAEALRDSFPSSDKSLSRLLGEAPYLPKSIFEMLESLCSPSGGDSYEKDLPGGDRVTQGLSIVWSLILLRPPIRDACLQIALKSAVHPLEEVRMKAIRLVANKLYPLSSISGRIEDFAKEMLLSVVTDDQLTREKETDRTHTELQKDENPSNENQPGSSATKEISPDSNQISAPESTSSSTVAEVQRCMSLYFALCTKKHSLFRQIFYVYSSTSKVAKQTVHRQLPLLVRTIGSSSDLLDIISDPPTGSEGLVIQVVHTLTDGTVPSPELVSTIKRLYGTKLKDIDILVPVLPFLSKDEVLLLFPHLVNVPPNKFQVVLSRFLQGSTPVLSPAEALIAIHKIDPDRDGVPLKKITDACNACFEQRQIFSQQVLAKVLNHLVEQIPLPFLFMRTVLQAIGAFPSLVQFIMEILSRLVSKQIWKNPRQWVGFVKCAHVTLPDSFGVLLQLPAAQLENALNRIPALKAPLVEHASQPNIRSNLPRSTLVVLGLESELPTSTQTQPTQNPTSSQTQPTQDPTSSQTQPTQNPTSSQTQPTQNSSSSQTQPTQNPSSSQTQTSQNETEETANSENEAATDKSKESPTTTTTTT